MSKTAIPQINMEDKAYKSILVKLRRGPVVTPLDRNSIVYFPFVLQNADIDYKPSISSKEVSKNVKSL